MKIIRLGLLIILGATNAALGDVTTYKGTGQTVYPVENKQIEMTYEKVVITYKPEEDRFYADCFFKLWNTWIFPTEAVVGFPDPLVEGNWNSPNDVQSALQSFQVWVDGKEIQPEFKFNIGFSPWDKNAKMPYVERNPIYWYRGAYLWRMKFNGWQTRTVRNTYNFLGTVSGGGFRGATYVLKTGKKWKGPIRKAEIIVLGLPIARFTSAEPKGYIFHGDTIIWRFKNFEPDADIEITAYLADQNWFYSAKNLLKEKVPNPDSLYFLMMEYDKIKSHFKRFGGKIPLSQLAELRDQLLPKMAEGHEKNAIMARKYLENGDTLKAIPYLKKVAANQKTPNGRDWVEYDGWSAAGVLKGMGGRAGKTAGR